MNVDGSRNPLSGPERTAPNVLSSARRESFVPGETRRTLRLVGYPFYVETLTTIIIQKPPHTTDFWNGMNCVYQPAEECGGEYSCHEGTGVEEREGRKVGSCVYMSRRAKGEKTGIECLQLVYQHLNPWMSVVRAMYNC